MRTLRELAADHADGKVGRKTFITERRRLIDGIVAGTMPLPPEATEPEPAAAVPPTSAPATERDITADLDRALPSAVPAGKRKPWLGIMVALAAAAAVAVAVAVALTQVQMRTTAPAQRGDAAAPSLLTRFVATNRWDEASLQRFMADWGALSEAQRSNLRGTPAMSQFGDLLQTRLNEARALLELGDRDDALAAERRLFDLAQALEFRNARLERAEAEWQIAMAGPAGPAGAAATPTVTTPVAATSEAKSAPAAARATETATDAVPSAGCPAELVTQRRPFCRDELASGGLGPLLAVLPQGAFTMGGRRPEESPRHRVTVGGPIAMSVFEISAGDLAVYCRATGASCPAQPWDDARYPAVNVPWRLASAYAEWLSAESHAHYRLPSEAEWEYAARAGTDTEYPFGDELLPIHARFSFQSPETKPLYAEDRSVNKNRFRLYHMAGNVREWVQDAWVAGYAAPGEAGTPRSGPDAGPHVVRGGSYADPAERLRSAARGPGPEAGDAFTGIRVMRELQPAAP